ncbi:MAG: hypothetical protein ACE14M_08460 [Terriglobales bacterium]
MTNANYTKLAWGLLAVWFTAAVSASVLQLFRNNSAQFGLPIAVAALTPILLFLLGFGISAGFRQFALSLSPRTLTLVQTWRIGGFVFLVLYTFGILPGLFALPAGWGDMAIGATAPLVALKLAGPGHRKGFILWQVLGITDLVTAVTLGTTARLITPQATEMVAMTVLPLSMIPTFVVPLLTIFHIICIAQARRWSEKPQSRFEEQLRPSAA